MPTSSIMFFVAKVKKFSTYRSRSYRYLNFVNEDSIIKIKLEWYDFRIIFLYLYQDLLYWFPLNYSMFWKYSSLLCVGVNTVCLNFI